MHTYSFICCRFTRNTPR